MSAPSGNSGFCFPLTVNVETLGKTKLAISLWSGHYLHGVILQNAYIDEG